MFYPGSGSEYCSIPDPDHGSGGLKSTGYRIRISNTERGRMILTRSNFSKRYRYQSNEERK
jgi:hypothetical protein